MNLYTENERNYALFEIDGNVSFAEWDYILKNWELSDDFLNKHYNNIPEELKIKHNKKFEFLNNADLIKVSKDFFKKNR